MSPAGRLKSAGGKSLLEFIMFVFGLENRLSNYFLPNLCQSAKFLYLCIVGSNKQTKQLPFTKLMKYTIKCFAHLLIFTALPFLLVYFVYFITGFAFQPVDVFAFPVFVIVTFLYVVLCACLLMTYYTEQADNERAKQNRYK